MTITLANLLQRIPSILWANTKVKHVLCVISIMLSMSCSAGAEKTLTVALDNPFQLQVGQSAQLNTEKLQVGLLAVTADSRCSMDEVCVWEGDAVVQIWLQMPGEAKQQFELHTNSRESNAADYAGYGLLLVSLSPAPVLDHKTEVTPYIATLQLIRGISGGRNIY